MSAAVPKNHTRKRWKQIKKNRQLYLFLLIPVAWIVIFRYTPMYGLIIAFKNYRPSKGYWGSEWIGLENFARFFGSYEFKRVLANTLGISAYSLLAGFPIPILLALALNCAMRKAFKSVVQFISYMPYFISTVVMVGIVMQFLNPRVGIVNMAITALGGEAVGFMGVPQYFKSIYIWSGVWQYAGWNSIIYIATLASVNPELHASAEIDGATRLQRVINIDVPCLTPTIVIMLILNMGQIMNIGFEKVFLMQNPLNLRTSEVISTYVYKVALGTAIADFSYATSIGLFNSVINLFLVVCVNYMAKKMGETSLW